MTPRLGRAHIECAIAFERSRAERGDDLPREGESWFDVRHGSGTVLVTAPHAMCAVRNGAIRPEDPGTGWLADALHTYTGVDAIMVTRTSPSDPNYYDDNAFKVAVAHHLQTRPISLVLDLHTAKSHRPFELDIGTMHGESVLGNTALVPTLVARLQKRGLSNFSDNFFPARKNQTITKWVSRRGVPCLQLEFNVSWLSIGRSPLGDLRAIRVLQGIADFIHDTKRGLVVNAVERAGVVRNPNTRDQQ
ncbi:MAG: hypothetical protein AAF493_06145 [Pseudomonadota bacterium]